MTNPRRIRPVLAPLRAVVDAPPSKSVTHRALIAAAIASGPSRLLAPLDSADTRATAEGLRALGIPVNAAVNAWRVEGGNGRIPGGGSLLLGDSGTSLRFLLALATLGEKRSSLDGSPRLRERPVTELAAALAHLGGKVTLHGSHGGVPADAGGGGLHGGEVVVPASRSSQFASALLLIGARLPRGIQLTLEAPAVSLPYVELTAEVLGRFGARVVRRDDLHWTVAPGSLRGTEFPVEGDHSSASYFLAAAALLGGVVRVKGLVPDSRQPDARLRQILAELGCGVRTGSRWVEVEGTGRIPPFDVDLADAPDLAPTLAVLGLFAEGPCTLRGIAHLRSKESDRLQVLALNLEALGRSARVSHDCLELGAPQPGSWRGATIATSSDHRVAMAFAVAGLRGTGVMINDADCVGKSYPGFWRDFAKLEGFAS